MKYAGDYKPYEGFEEEDSFKPRGHFLGYSQYCKSRTEDIRKVLVEIAGTNEAAWKRAWRKNYQIDEFDNTVTYRVFENKVSGRFVTVLIYGGDAWLFDFNLKDYKDEIDKVNKHALKHFLGVDYTHIYYNPFEKIVWMPMSDGGSFSVDDVSKFMKDLKDKPDDKREDAVDKALEKFILKKHAPETGLDFVKDTLYSDEFSPPLELCFLPVGYYGSYEDLIW